MSTHMHVHSNTYIHVVQVLYAVYLYFTTQSTRLTLIHVVHVCTCGTLVCTCIYRSMYVCTVCTAAAGFPVVVVVHFRFAVAFRFLGVRYIHVHDIYSD